MTAASQASKRVNCANAKYRHDIVTQRNPVPKACQHQFVFEFHLTLQTPTWVRAAFPRGPKEMPIDT